MRKEALGREAIALCVGGQANRRDAIIFCHLPVYDLQRGSMEGSMIDQAGLEVEQSVHSMIRRSEWQLGLHCFGSRGTAQASPISSRNNVPEPVRCIRRS